VDCFYEGKNMLVIDPKGCIDCGVCVSECPAKAIIPDTEPGAAKWVEINAEYAAKWPNIRRFKSPPKDADQWLNIPNKYEKYFDPNPGEGDT
jgi:ferredoxin